jgi:hypothetical protein
MRETIKFEDGSVTYDNSEKAIYRLQQVMLEWYTKHDAWDGEIIFQSDDCLITAPELVAEVADKVFKFKAKYE